MARQFTGLVSTPAILTISRVLRNNSKTASVPEHQFTERLARQHKLLLQLRNASAKPSITHLPAEYRVARKTIIRDLHDLIRRGQLDAAVYPRV